MIKDQWFVKMRGLADQEVLENQKSEKTKVQILPRQIWKTMNVGWQ